jgi:hypothetical protein
MIPTTIKIRETGRASISMKPVPVSTSDKSKSRIMPTQIAAQLGTHTDSENASK